MIIETSLAPAFFFAVYTPTGVGFFLLYIASHYIIVNNLTFGVIKGSGGHDRPISRTFSNRE